MTPRRPAAVARTGGAMLQLFATCPRGLEQPLAEELSALGARGCQSTGGGVAFEGQATLAMAVNLHSRIASRILMQAGSGRYRDEDALYRLVRRIEWEQWFDQHASLRVDVSAQRSPLRSLNFAALRVKDAICDRFRDQTGERPSVDTRTPDVRVFAFLETIDATIYLDLSGESLFKRGWRAAEDSAGIAPLKENLAAGLLALSGWQPATALHDPLCGSGTLLIEAAQRALDIAPGRGRRFGFERLRGFDTRSFADLRQVAEHAADAARERLRSSGTTLPISGADVDPGAVERTRRNLLRAGIPEGAVALRVADFCALGARPDDLPEHGVIVTNPPYGERLHAHPGTTDATGAGDATGESDDRRGFGTQHESTAEDAAHRLAMQRIGTTLRRAFGGWQACLLSPDTGLPRQLGMQPRRRAPLFNGALECRLYCFEIFERADRAVDAGSANCRSADRPASPADRSSSARPVDSAGPPAAERLAAVRERIRRACAAAGRPDDSVALLAVSKTWEARRVLELAALGQRAFGENYLQEALDKIDACGADASAPIEWHFIGPIQSNKTRPIAEHFDWVHSIDREKIALRLSEQRPAHRGALQVCVQVNVSGEASKSGCGPNEALELALKVAQLPGLHLRGLMTIPEPADDVAVQRARFATLRTLGQGIGRELGRIGAGLASRFDTLSMGMSDDLEAAIAEGATLVRVGTALFGQRQLPVRPSP